MKVVVIGGTGVFGDRLVRLLVRDGHQVVVVGRGAAALARIGAELGVDQLVLDRAADLTPLWALAPDVVVDAAGPFHAYGSDPYRLARAAIAHCVNYLDLADDAAFCAGIGALDSDARAAGVFALSGVSSVPALSSCVVKALAEGLTEIDTISTAILPGNRAPRGRSVVDSILHQTGTQFATIIDGQPEMVRSWSRPQRFDLGDVSRKGWMIEVPDQRLFPRFFNARTVEFRAGMELGVMNHGLAALSWFRGKIGFGMPRWLLGLVRFGAALLAPFGTNRGGMQVTVTGQGQAGWTQRRWTLVVGSGEGPYIPGIAVRTILRDPALVPPGAKPALAEVSLAAAEAAIADLDVTLTRADQPVVPLFQQALGPDFARLPDAVRASHDHAGPRRWSGNATITRGGSLLARAIAMVFAFPKAGLDVPVTVLKTPTALGEIWDRHFGAGLFRSHLQLTPKGMTERFGPMTFLLRLGVKDGGLNYPVVAGRCLGLPIPRFMLPKNIAREFERDGRFHFDVALYAPLRGGMIVHYAGFLVPDSAPDLQASDNTL